MSDRRIRRTSALSALMLTGVAVAGTGILCDAFDDGVIDPMWTVITQDPAVIGIVEEDGRLEFPASGGGEAFAGAVSRWTLDAFEDFQIKLDYAAAAPASGEAGISFVVVFGGEIEKGEIVDGFVMDAGHDDDGPFYCITQWLGGLEFFTCDVSGGDGTSMYMWYDAAADRVRVSFIGFGDLSTGSGIMLRESSGTDRVQVAFAGFVVDAPPVNGDNLWVDNVCVVDGVILPATPPADINGDGAVDLTDLLTVLGSWGPCAECPADVNADGVVDIGDLLALLAAWDPGA
ncbi:MAG: hypothetical protein AB8G96_17440 [Phycisphaerales bacterium]